MERYCLQSDGMNLCKQADRSQVFFNINKWGKSARYLQLKAIFNIILMKRRLPD